MTYTFSPSNKPSTGSIAVYNLKTALKSVGWNVKSSSDGTTYNSTSDQISSGASGAGGLGNSNAWFRIQQPMGTAREFTFQRISDTSWRVKYSGTANFTGGSPSATQTPTATDEQVMLGGGTDASPTGTSWFVTNNTYTQHIAIGNNSDGYCFYNICILNGGSASGTPLSGTLICDVLEPGSVHPDDLDPAILYVSTTGTTLSAGTINLESAGNVDKPKGWIKKGLAGEGFVTISGVIYTNNITQIIPSNIRPNVYSQKEKIFPIFYMRRSAASVPNGYKGLGRMMKWNGFNHAYGTTITVSTASDRIIFGDVNFPWDGSIPKI